MSSCPSCICDDHESHYERTTDDAWETVTCTTAQLPTVNDYKTSELMIIRHATASVLQPRESLPCAIILHQCGLKPYTNFTEDSLNLGGQNLRLLKSMVDAKNFIRRFSWSISSDFGAIHPWNVRHSLKSPKNSCKKPFWGSRSFKAISGVGTTGNLVSSACYAKQQLCVYLQPFSR